MIVEQQNNDSNNINSTMQQQNSSSSPTSSGNSSSTSGAGGGSSQQHLQNLRIMAEFQKRQEQQGSTPVGTPTFLPRASIVSASSSFPHQQQLQPSFPNDESCSSLTSASSAPSISVTNKSPTRGVKKTSSLRRGAAGYNQLLQSAVMASIQTSQSADIKPKPPPPSPVDSIIDQSHSRAGSWESSSDAARKKRHRSSLAPAIPSRKMSGSRQRSRDGEDDDDEDMMVE